MKIIILFEIIMIIRVKSNETSLKEVAELSKKNISLEKLLIQRRNIIKTVRNIVKIA